MTIISNLLGIALAYAIGFYVAVRTLHEMHGRRPFLKGENDSWMLAAVWPALLVITVIVGIAKLLIEAATRDLR